MNTKKGGHQCDDLFLLLVYPAPAIPIINIMNNLAQVPRVGMGAGDGCGVTSVMSVTAAS